MFDEAAEPSTTSEDDFAQRRKVAHCICAAACSSARCAVAIVRSIVGVARGSGDLILSSNLSSKMHLISKDFSFLFFSVLG